jgi:hypothetical protein
MKPLMLILLLLGASFAQDPIRSPVSPPSPGRDADVRLPNGKLQRDEIAKADYKKNLDDATELLKLVTDLQSDLDKQGAYIVSLKSIKQTEDIEKLAKNIRGRLKRY